MFVLVVDAHFKTGVSHVDITGVNIRDQPGSGTEECVRVKIKERMAAVVAAGKIDIVEGSVDTMIAQA